MSEHRNSCSPSFSGLFLLLAILGFGLTSSACMKDNQKKPKAKEQPGGDVGTSDDVGTDDVGSADGDFIDDDGSDNTDGGDPIAELLASCGGQGVADQDENTVIYEKTIKSIPKEVALSLVTIGIDVAIKVTPKESVQDAIVKIEAGGGFIEGLLSIFAEKNTGKTTATNVPFSDFSSLADHSAWEGILCTFVPATKLVNERGGRTVVSFDPPMPLTVSPKAVKERYATEIGDRKEFAGLKVKIEETDSNDLAGKTEVTGSVVVEKVDPKLVYKDAAGTDQELIADLAYRMTFNFESEAVTQALGLPPEMTYYISHEKKEILANILNTKTFLTGSFTFIH